MNETENANTYISAKQNGRHLVDKNEFYSLIRKRNDKAYYACINKKKMNCSATAIVTGDKITKKSGTHINLFYKYKILLDSSSMIFYCSVLVLSLFYSILFSYWRWKYETV